jgi:hypothetical protein
VGAGAALSEEAVPPMSNLGEKNLYERQFDEAPNQGHPEKNPNRLLNLNV